MSDRRPDAERELPDPDPNLIPNPRDRDRDVAPGGTYTLVLELPSAATIRVGALGTRAFDAGWYAYTGSALGPGGFARVDRHREVASGAGDTRHWHVDYLLGHSGTTVESVVRTPGEDIECAVGRGIDGEPVEGFGASDCDCRSHLVFDARRDPLLSSVRRAHDRHRQ